MFRFRLLVQAVLLALVLGVGAGCHQPAYPVQYPLIGHTVFTQTNLHPDTRRDLLYSINYQREGLIPLCTPVYIQSVDTRQMIFVDRTTGRYYRYVFHHATTEPIAVHLDLYFGPQCPDLDALQLNDIDYQGIDSGRVLGGMSKNGVLLAIGYPPVHQTPSLDLNRWTYWRNRSRRFVVYFQDGVVVRIRH